MPLSIASAIALCLEKLQPARQPLIACSSLVLRHHSSPLFGRRYFRALTTPGVPGGDVLAGKQEHRKLPRDLVLGSTQRGSELSRPESAIALRGRYRPVPPPEP